jgi:hypothetical protein
MYRDRSSGQPDASCERHGACGRRALPECRRPELRVEVETGNQLHQPRPAGISGGCSGVATRPHRTLRTVRAVRRAPSPRTDGVRQRLREAEGRGGRGRTPPGRSARRRAEPRPHRGRPFQAAMLLGSCSGRVGVGSSGRRCCWTWGLPGRRCGRCVRARRSQLLQVEGIGGSQMEPRKKCQSVSRFRRIAISC